MWTAEALRRIDDSVRRVLADQMLPADPRLRQWVDEYACNSRYRLAQDLDMVQRYARRGARVLEFGSCPLLLSLALHQMGYDFHGLDIAPERFAKLIDQYQLDIRKVDFETQPVPWESESFDLIIFNAVFEHLRINLIATMTEVRRVMKTAGTLLLSTPNLRSLRGLWMLLRHQASCHLGTDLYEQYERLNLYGHMGHVREYTTREVSVFLSKVGLRTRAVEYQYFGPPLNNPFPLALVALLERLAGLVLPSFRPLFTLVGEKSPVPPGSTTSPRGTGD